MSKRTAQISEIFKSIQGEGKFVGVQQIFIRFFGCNMHCVWCDTPQSIGDTTQEFKTYSINTLLKEVTAWQEEVQSISLTGGEPLMQVSFIQDLLPQLKKIKKDIHLETNGIYYEELKEIINDVDVVAIDLKLPSSTQEKSFWIEHEKFLQEAVKKEVFIKAVISNKTEENDVVKARDLIASINPNILFILQPNSLEIRQGVIEKCIKFQSIGLQKLQDVRVMLQMHKFMKIR